MQAVILWITLGSVESLSLVMIAACVGIWMSPSEGQEESSSRSPRGRNTQEEIYTSILFGFWDFFSPVPLWLFLDTLEIFDLLPLRSTQISFYQVWKRRGTYWKTTFIFHIILLLT